MAADGSLPIEAGERKPTAWLRRHRFRIVLWIAVIEGVVVWATHGLHLWTIVVLSLVALASLFLYRLTQEKTRSPFLHELAWLLAASQLGADVLVAAGYLLLGLLVILLVVFAAAALVILVLERR
ncbi:MAG: hypothetical protein ACRDLK_07865 [Gaiellaceae bacterium]